jgi:two-component system sensor histidine kinase ChiS
MVEKNSLILAWIIRMKALEALGPGVVLLCVLFLFGVLLLLISGMVFYTLFIQKKDRNYSFDEKIKLSAAGVYFFLCVGFGISLFSVHKIWIIIAEFLQICALAGFLALFILIFLRVKGVFVSRIGIAILPASTGPIDLETFPAGREPAKQAEREPVETGPKPSPEASPQEGSAKEAAAEEESAGEPEPVPAEEPEPEELEELSEAEEVHETPVSKQASYNKPNPFIPREFLEILHKDSVADLRLGDHVKQEMTIFFSDIRQFTALSEKLSPDESFKFINSYLARIVPVIGENGGFVDKYIGDAILALFPKENGPNQAIQTAIEIQNRVVEYNVHRKKVGYEPLAMGIGIHTGTLMMGVVGIHGRMQNTVISDSVNLASRLESMTKAFGVSLTISEETFQKLADPGAYKFRYLGQMRVKGKIDPVRVFEIYDGIDPSLMERKIKTNRYFEEGMFSYSKKDYGAALDNFRKVREILPEDKASIFYMDYCIERMEALSQSRGKMGHSA